jgi:hypothetical protein
VGNGNEDLEKSIEKSTIMFETVKKGIEESEAVGCLESLKKKSGLLE